LQTHAFAAEEAVKKNLKLQARYLRLFFSTGSKSKAFTVGRDIRFGNELFRKMLDKRMVYSCGYWKHAGTLDEARKQN